MSEKLVQLMVYVRHQKTKDGKRSFVKYSTKMNLREVNDEDVLTEEKINHYVEVKFTKEVLAKTEIVRGLYTCKAKDVSAPNHWKIGIDEKTGNDKYPVVWVRGIEEIKPIAKEHEFDFDTSDSEDEFVDEEETEETDID